MLKFPNRYRLRDGPLSSNDNERFGAFIIPYKGIYLECIASDADDKIRFEHVSVKASSKDFRVTDIPQWEEMCFIKSLFWDDEDIVMQLHPKKSEYINQHPHVLHLWRPVDKEIPAPPTIAVGIKT